MNFDDLLRQPLIIPLGWALLHFLWQGALIAMLLAIVNAVLRKAAANTRYAAACCALGLMLVSAAGTFIWLGSEVSRNAAASEAAAPAGMAAVRAPGVAAHLPAAAFGAQLADYFPWIVAAWFGGVFLLSVRSAGGWLAAQRLKVKRTAPVEPAWEQRLAALRRRLNVSRPVRLSKSAIAEVPTVVGWLRPVILVPAGAFAGLDARQLEAVLAHELAHIRRHDYLVNLFQTAIETLLFYHPAVWWVGQRIRIEREHCCDDMAVSACGDVAVYARALTAIEELRGGTTQFAMAADGGVLLARIRRLIGVKPAGFHGRRACLAGVVAVLTAAAVWTGAQAAQRPAHAAPLVVAFSAVPEPTPEPEPQEPRPTPAAGAKSSGFVAGLADAGYPDLSTDQLVAFKIHGVTPEYVRDIRAAGMTDLSPDDLVAFRIHGVDAAKISELHAAGFKNLDADDVVALQIHQVTADFARRVKALGLGDPSMDDLVAMKIHNVTPEFASEIKALGIGHLDIDQLVAFRIHNVNPAQVRELQSLLGKLSADDAVAMRIHNVTPEFVRGLKSAGVAQFDADDAVAAAIHGITPGFVKEAQKHGMKNPTIDRLVELKTAGVFDDDII